MGKLEQCGRPIFDDLAVDIHDSAGITEHVLSVGDTIAYSTSSMHRRRQIGRGTTRFLVIVNDQ